MRLYCIKVEVPKPPWIRLSFHLFCLDKAVVSFILLVNGANISFF